MIQTKEYLRDRAVMYARKYALVRNPLFYTFEGIGGNCTNFVSQSILAGSCVMNFEPIFGWFYLSTNRRAPAWTGVEFFYNFITSNQSVGPFGKVVDVSQIQIGDVIQLQNEDDVFYHTLIVSAITEGEIFVCANSVDSLDRPLSSYTYKTERAIHIEGVRFDTRYIIDCFESLYNPPLPPVQPEAQDQEGEVPEAVPQDSPQQEPPPPPQS
ncbi:MAG: amidase domain-containing protein [Clostridia bacterium]|nr:amidase domain-containing protein [Clostridia bacterium]